MTISLRKINTIDLHHMAAICDVPEVAELVGRDREAACVIARIALNPYLPIGLHATVDELRLMVKQEISLRGKPCLK